MSIGTYTVTSCVVVCLPGIKVVSRCVLTVHCICLLLGLANYTTQESEDILLDTTFMLQSDPSAFIIMRQAKIKKYGQLYTTFGRIVITMLVRAKRLCNGYSALFI
jgi:hypothetical protein